PHGPGSHRLQEHSRAPGAALRRRRQPAVREREWPGVRRRGPGALSNAARRALNRPAPSDPAELKVLIVDDERLARAKLRRFLTERRSVRVVGEAANGAEAFRRIQEQRPDLVFLDIQMPGMDGFELLAKIPCDPMPAVVFVTAHDEHAVRAFDAEALDYLLKPFDRARFSKTLDRARLARRRDPEQLLADLRRLLEKAGPERRPLRRIAVRSQGRMHSHRVEEIH